MAFKPLALVVVLGCDHAGYALVRFLESKLTALGVRCVWAPGSSSGGEASDYPDAAKGLASALSKKSFGILACGTGIGISMAANRHRGIRAALCRDAQDAEMGRRHNDANVLVLGARKITQEAAWACVEVFLQTPFEGGRHLKRLQKFSTRLPKTN